MSTRSSYVPLTKSDAIERIEDIEHLRAVAHRMWEAFFAAHSQASHAIGVLMGYELCGDCSDSFEGQRDTGCEQWRAWQQKVTAGFGSV